MKEMLACTPQVSVVGTPPPSFRMLSPCHFEPENRVRNLGLRERGWVIGEMENEACYCAQRFDLRDCFAILAALEMTVAQRFLAALEMTVAQRFLAPLEMTVAQRFLAPLEMTVAQRFLAALEMTVAQGFLAALEMTVLYRLPQFN